MTNARRLLILSAVFFAFFVVGAIFANAPAEGGRVEWWIGGGVVDAIRNVHHSLPQLHSIQPKRPSQFPEAETTASFPHDDFEP
ncbi:MAG: hypothetical protein L6R35_004861 [Caloplaca aegaea]|nr:MAG: hypothetical protein L6R35_004861 [Caloplaca aegaea]